MKCKKCKLNKKRFGISICIECYNNCFYDDYITIKSK